MKIIDIEYRVLRVKVECEHCNRYVKIGVTRYDQEQHDEISNMTVNTVYPMCRKPLKKYLNPQEVADMAGFLISDKASAISGQIFQLDCGIVSFKL